MNRSNLPPGVSERMLPGWDDEEPGAGLADYCDTCGRSEGHHPECLAAHPEVACTSCGAPVGDADAYVTAHPVMGTLRLCRGCQRY